MNQFFAGALACMFSLLVSFATAAAAETTVLSSRFEPLDKAVGTWVYHGTNEQTAFTKAGSWTWTVDCGWSSNRIFLTCSFVMNWPEGPDHSISISTYNKLDKSYWHYEIIDDYPGNKPVVSRMTIVGNTWTDSSESVSANGKTASHYRVIYHYTSPTTVDVTFQESSDAIHWTVLGHGEGVKQP
jgi:hypothetical protein